MADVSLPAGVLIGDTTLRITFRRPEEFTPTLGSFLEIDHFADLSLGNGQSAFVGGASASLRFGYADADNDGLVDGFDIPEDSLGLYWYDGSEWQAVDDFQVEPFLNYVTGDVSHFTPFAILSSPSTSVKEWQTY
jgi:hypothetical protein